jgi:hypothetical protein
MLRVTVHLLLKFKNDFSFSSCFNRDQETNTDIAIKIDTTPVLILPREVQDLPPKLRSQEMSSMLEGSSQYKVTCSLIFKMNLPQHYNCILMPSLCIMPQWYDLIIAGFMT